MSLTKNLRGRSVLVVSVMGLELSGLAITVERYADALRLRGYRACAYVIGDAPHAECGEVNLLPDLRALGNVILAEAVPPFIFWVGIHTLDDEYLSQLHMMRDLRALGAVNIVMPERTEMPERTHYALFERLVGEGDIAALTFFNELQMKSWPEPVGVPMRTLRPPIPDGLFNSGAARLATHPQVDRERSALVFVGRLSRRKGLDVLASVWDDWRISIARAVGHLPSLLIYGQSFLGPLDEGTTTLVTRNDNGVVWQPNFPTEDHIAAWPSSAVGISLSRQEFDGIAISELLATGVPVLATPTDGHLALSSETRALSIVHTTGAFCEAVKALLVDPLAVRAKGMQAREDMLATRSMASIGVRFEDLLHALA